MDGKATQVKDAKKHRTPNAARHGETGTELHPLRRGILDLCERRRRRPPPWLWQPRSRRSRGRTRPKGRWRTSRKRPRGRRRDPDEQNQDPDVDERDAENLAHLVQFAKNLFRPARPGLVRAEGQTAAPPGGREHHLAVRDGGMSRTTGMRTQEARREPGFSFAPARNEYTLWPESNKAGRPAGGLDNHPGRTEAARGRGTRRHESHIHHPGSPAGIGGDRMQYGRGIRRAAGRM